METRKIDIFLFITVFLLLNSCGYKKRDFFQQMNNPIEDVKMDSNSYFIKSFNFSSRPTKINGRDYWELNNSPESYFPLSGYLRYYNNMVFIVPNGYETDSFREYKLFDFNAQKNSSWKIVHRLRNGSQFGDSVVFLNNRILSRKRDTIYYFSLTTFFARENNNQYLYDVPVFNLAVSKRYGIIDITESDIESRAINYRLQLLPRKIFSKIKHPYIKI